MRFNKYIFQNIIAIKIYSSVHCRKKTGRLQFTKKGALCTKEHFRRKFIAFS